MFRLLIIGGIALQATMAGALLAQEPASGNRLEAQPAKSDMGADHGQGETKSGVKKSPEPPISDQIVAVQVPKDEDAEESSPEGERLSEPQITKADPVVQRRIDIAWWQLWASIAGLIAIFWTLYETRKAVKMAQRSAKAAEDATEVAREVGRSQVRAYLQITGLECAINPASNHVSLSIACRNSGQSPARGLGYLVQMSVNYDSDVSLPYETRYTSPFGDIASGEIRKSHLTYPGLRLRPDHYSKDFIGLANIEFRIVFVGQDVFDNEVSATLERWWCRPDTGTPIKKGFDLEWVDDVNPSAAIRDDERQTLKRFAPQKQADIQK